MSGRHREVRRSPESGKHFRGGGEKGSLTKGWNVRWKKIHERNGTWKKHGPFLPFQASSAAEWWEEKMAKVVPQLRLHCQAVRYPLFDMVAFWVQEKIRCLSWRLCWWPQCFFRPVLQTQDTTHSTEGFVPHGSHLGNHWIVVTTGTSTKMRTCIAWCSWNHPIQRKCTGRLTTLMCWCHCFYLVHVFVQCCVPFHLWYSRVATKGVVKLP